MILCPKYFLNLLSSPSYDCPRSGLIAEMAKYVFSSLVLSPSNLSSTPFKHRLAHGAPLLITLQWHLIIYRLKCPGSLACCSRPSVIFALPHLLNSAIQNWYFNFKSKALSCTISLSPKLVLVHSSRLRFLLEACPHHPSSTLSITQYIYFFCRTLPHHQLFCVSILPSATRLYDSLKPETILNTFIFQEPSLWCPEYTFYMSRWMREWKVCDNLQDTQELVWFYWAWPLEGSELQYSDSVPS